MEQDLRGNATVAVVVGEQQGSLVRVAHGVAPQAALPPPDDGATTTSRAAALLRALQRLESVIDEEVSALQQRLPVDFDQFSRRKNRSLLELSRSSKALDDAGRNPVITSEVTRLRTKLEQNRNMLRLHYEAVRAVSDIICRSIWEAESDGTYPATAGRTERR